MDTYSSTIEKEEVNEKEIPEVVNRAKKGDKNSKEKLFGYIYPKLYRFIYYRTNNKTEAQDLTGDVILKIAKALPGQRGNFNSWIFRIARNTIIDFYRKKSVRKGKMSVQEMPGELPDENKDFTEQILNEEALKKAMGFLTERQKEVIILKFIEGYKNREIAKIIGTSEGAVKLLQFRAYFN
ncbi:MAG: RNA polymerase sigma factor [candidate division WOR-3 bacterium]